MYNQLKVEFYKLKTSIVFYLLLILFVIIGVSYGIVKLIPMGISGSQSFLSTIGDTSFMFVFTLFIGYFVGSDFSNRTINNEIKIGYSRLSVIGTRWLIVLPAITLFHIIYVFFTMLPCAIVNGFGMEISIQGMFIRIILVLFQIMSIQSFAMFIMFICKKSSLGIIVSVCFTFVTCNILRNFFGQENLFFKFTSFYRIMMNSKLMTANDLIISFISAIVTLIVVLYSTHVAFRRTEIK